MNPKRGKDASVYGKKIASNSPRGTSQSTYRTTTGGQRTGGTLSETLSEVTPALHYLQSRKFKVMGKLGEGNYAQVYRIRRLDNKDLAAKIIDLSKCSNNYRTNFFPREVEVMGKLKHKNITEILEIQKLEEIVVIIMEYASGGTLADFISQHKAMPEFLAKPIIAQLVEALHYMHQINIAHRDLKVENILLDKSMNPKLTDFSYSTFVKFDEKTKEVIKTKTFCGSIIYIPPEILQEKEYDPRQADIWSFGVCIYVATNNTIPFKVGTLPELKTKQQKKEYAFKQNVTVSNELKEVVGRMLEPDPAKRISSKDLLLHQYFRKAH